MPTSDTCSPRLIAPVTLRLGDDETARLADMFKALGHPVRLRILDILSRLSGEVCVCDIEQQFDLSQPTISHHLKVLRQAGLVDSEQRGLWVYYALKPGSLDRMRAVLTDLLPD